MRAANSVSSLPLTGGGLGRGSKPAWGSKSAWASYRVALALLIALCSSPPARADDADLGREVYEEFCVTCHGRDLVNPGGVTFDLRKFPKDDFERFRSAVLNGKPPAMPAWRGKVGDDDMKLLWAYVRGGG